MAGVRLQVDVRGFKAIRARMDALAGFDPGALLDAVGAELESQTRRRIEDAGGGSGPAHTDLGVWPAWSERYARTRHAGHSLLIGESDLLDSLQYIVAGSQVQVGSNLPYAAIQQFGGAEVGRPGHPPRPYLGVSADNERELLAVVNGYLDEVLA